ncbi:unannotated protein [freshwater metagenome]|uniref:Unannotated protein n=1 Tax=freshwater metagenome TaxID=449393 RepID=A0A6J7SKZ6_9ZZZZ|nr:hypothetical protein [Actinomycetota bacterium]
MSNINKLVKALDNNDNENIMNLTTRKIMKMNLQILKELMLDRNTTINYLRKLKGYKFVDEINDLKHGSFIRWIPIIDPDNLPLTQCGMICDIKITDDGVIIVCKNFMHRHYTFKMDEVLIFQKLTSQEMVILSALDHLEKEQNEMNIKDKSEDDEESDDEESDDEESDE